MENRLIFLYRRGIVITDGVTQKDSPACHWMCRFKRVGGSGRQIRSVHQRRGVMSRPSGHKRADSMLPRKTSKESPRLTVPQTDTGRRGENPKALE